MKSIQKISLLLLSCIALSCDENETPKDRTKLLLGQWNSYEQGTEQTGFTAGITSSLTIVYESGIAFSSDGTFRSRYHYNETWTESKSATGTFELKDDSISFLFSPGTIDEYKFDVQLIKLDNDHLWIRHSLFVQTEFHLERAHD